MDINNTLKINNQNKESLMLKSSFNKSDLSNLSFGTGDELLLSSTSNFKLSFEIR